MVRALAWKFPSGMGKAHLPALKRSLQVAFRYQRHGIVVALMFLPILCLLESTYINAIGRKWALLSSRKMRKELIHAKRGYLDKSWTTRVISEALSEHQRSDFFASQVSEVHANLGVHGGHGRQAPVSFPAIGCPPLYNDSPDCKDRSPTSIPPSVLSVAKGLARPFSGPFTLLRGSVREGEDILSSMPPNVSKAVRIGRANAQLLKILPVQDPAFGSKNHYHTCAVVGSSGSLLASGRGADIDSHSLVFRFNSAPTRGFEADVGGRTTHRITNSRNFGFRDHADEVVFVHLRSPGPLRRLVALRRARPSERTFGINPEFYQYMDRAFEFLSTSGLCGIVMALHKCVQIDLYGFHVSTAQGVPYHYYNTSDVPANTDRDNREWLVVKALAKGGMVNFREPCIVECHDSHGEDCVACLFLHSI